MLRYLGRLVRARPRTTLLGLTLLVLLGTGLGLYCYALHQWYAAQSALKAGQPAKARERLGFCLFIWPGSAEAHLLAARAAWLSGDFDGAEVYVKQCMRFQKGATEASQLECLLIRAQRGEEDEVAAALFTHVDNKHPDSPLILETLARAYMHHLRHGQAYDCLSRWIKEAPETAKAFYWRGWTLERLNNHHDAMEDYSRALELDPDFTPVRLRLAEILLDKNQPLEAILHLERLRKQFPDRPDILVRWGHCCFLQGRGEEARNLLEAAVIKLPDDPPLLLQLARLELQEGRSAEAEQWLRRALKADPTDTVAQYLLVSSLRLQGRPKEASAALDRYKEQKALQERINLLLRDEARRPSKGPSAPWETGVLLFRIGQERAGLYWLGQALLRDPQHQPTHQAMAEYFEKKGEGDKAAAHRRRLSEPIRKAPP